MHKKITKAFIPAALFFALITPAFAESDAVNVGVQGSAQVGTQVETKATIRAQKIGAKDAAIVKRSGIEIEKRVTDLSKLESHLGDLKHLSDETRAALSATIQKNISDLNTLKSKIEGDSDLSVLRTDQKSITAGMRVYMDLIPQTKILAAADSANSVIAAVAAMNAKLDTRVSQAQTAGQDVSAIATIQADITAKLADAKVQSDAAASAVVAIVPDNGNATVMTANKTALKTARTALAAVEKDLKAVRKDQKSILAALKTLHVEASTKVESSASTQETKGENNQ